MYDNTLGLVLFRKYNINVKRLKTHDTTARMREKIITTKAFPPGWRPQDIYVYILYYFIFVGIVYTGIKRHMSTTRIPTTCVLVVRLCKDISKRDDSGRVEGYNIIKGRLAASVTYHASAFIPFDLYLSYFSSSSYYYFYSSF